MVTRFLRPLALLIICAAFLGLYFGVGGEVLSGVPEAIKMLGAIVSGAALIWDVYRKTFGATRRMEVAAGKVDFNANPEHLRQEFERYILQRLRGGHELLLKVRPVRQASGGSLSRPRIVNRPKSLQSIGLQLAGASNFRVVLVGVAGAGTSLALRRIATIVSKANTSRHSVIPCVVDLRGWNAEREEFETWMRRACNEQCPGAGDLPILGSQPDSVQQSLLPIFDGAHYLAEDIYKSLSKGLGALFGEVRSYIMGLREESFDLLRRRSTSAPLRAVEVIGLQRITQVQVREYLRAGLRDSFGESHWFLGASSLDDTARTTFLEHVDTPRYLNLLLQALRIPSITEEAIAAKGAGSHAEFEQFLAQVTLDDGIDKISKAMQCDRERLRVVRWLKSVSNDPSLARGESMTWWVSGSLRGRRRSSLLLGLLIAAGTALPGYVVTLAVLGGEFAVVPVAFGFVVGCAVTLLDVLGLRSFPAMMRARLPSRSEIMTGFIGGLLFSIMALVIMGLLSPRFDMKLTWSTCLFIGCIGIGTGLASATASGFDTKMPVEMRTSPRKSFLQAQLAACFYALTFGSIASAVFGAGTFVGFPYIETLETQPNRVISTIAVGALGGLFAFSVSICIPASSQFTYVYLCNVLVDRWPRKYWMFLRLLEGEGVLVQSQGGYEFVFPSQRNAISALPAPIKSLRLKLRDS